MPLNKKKTQPNQIKVNRDIITIKHSEMNNDLALNNPSGVELPLNK